MGVREARARINKNNDKSSAFFYGFRFSQYNGNSGGLEMTKIIITTMIIYHIFVGKKSFSVSGE